MALRACWEQAGQAARCSSFTLGKAINFALENDARVINLSLGGPPDRLLQTLLDAAIVRGVAVVGAVDPKQPDGGFPASHPGVIAVAAGGAGGAVLHAPGTDIPASLPGGRWGLVSGSSYAAAHVSGLAALLLELRPRMDVAQLRTTLGSQAGTAPILRTSGAAGAPEQVSAGSIDACAAVARAAGACVCQCPSTVAATSRHTPGNHVH
jgi:subtilisin family serine protease